MVGMFYVSGLARKEPGEVWVQTGCCTECQGCVKYYLQETTILSSGQVWICGFHRSRDCGASLQARRCCGAESIWGADSGLIVANMSFFEEIYERMILQASFVKLLLQVRVKRMDGLPAQFYRN